MKLDISRDHDERRKPPAEEKASKKRMDGVKRPDPELRSLKAWFEENRSLDTLSLFTKFYSRL